MDEPKKTPTPFVSTLPHKPGVYIMRDRAGAILYIGKAVDLAKRVANYFRANAEPKIRALASEIRHVDFITAESEREALIIEQRLINRHQPLYNTMFRDDKTYPYVKISVNEDFPRIYLTRQRRKDGGLYYGPYPHVSTVKKMLHWIWKKKLFPLRPCKLEFTEKVLPPFRKVQSCLYLHTGECPAPCVGKISKKDYGRIAERAALFFEGKHDRLRAFWKKEMKAAAKKLQFERAAQWRNQLEALEHIQQRVTFRALRPEDVQSRIQSSQALQELQKALELPRPPVRIEAFDISHVQGAETVASLVVFEKGKPAKNHYRKFKIRTVQGVDDFASMREVVGRRYKRVREEGLPWPDLILIDGGAGQLSAALEALKALGGRRPPVASLAKQEEEIYLPDQQEPLKLPKDSPALHVLQHIRDESHRFAVSFHRQRRGKTLLSGGEPL